MSPRVLFLLPTQSYRAPEFIEAARRLGAALTVAAETPNLLADRNPAGYLTLDFEKPEAAAEQARAFARRHPLDAVLGADDLTSELAARLARSLGLPGNPPEAVRRCRDKRLGREALAAAGLPVPRFRAFSANEGPARAARAAGYPCVLKPTTLSAGRGVIRADGPEDLARAWRRVIALIAREKAAPEVLVEDFIPGREAALEGLLDGGRLKVLALFDKPDPMDGPYFEETFYIRPSRLPARDQEEIASTAARALAALGLVTGPVHAELRVNGRGAWIIEAAARPIGGRCSRALSFGAGLSLEELVLRQALGLPHDAEADPEPSGVLMIPIPGAGILKEVRGLAAARAVPGVTELLMAARAGTRFTPFPEGSPYPGFVFSRAKTPEAAETALREAHRRLEFILDPLSAEAAAPAAACEAPSA